MIDVNQVYQTVLLILNKEQRGYMTPEEFNKTATQVQRRIFERYFDDLNQQVRVPQSNFDYADRVDNIDEKIAEFKTENVVQLTTATDPPMYNFYELPDDLYRLNTVTFDANTLPPAPTGPPGPPIPRSFAQPSYAVELERLGRNEFYNINNSPLTKPDFGCPVYLYEDNKLIVFPQEITNKLRVTYVKKPSDINWAFQTIGSGAYVYDQPSSTQFELHNSEQVEVVINILLYAGVVVRDPSVVQVANQEIQQEEVNEKQ
tara:strand:+ start:3304 stop:4083 length:780 start_codon:yes stop_codon:yes gene_type:complete